MKAGKAAIALLFVAGCGNGGDGNKGTANLAVAPPADNRLEDVAPLPAAPQPDLEGARVLIGRIYGAYAAGRTPELGRDVYTPELQTAILRQSDADNGLGYDPFCRCQDFENFRFTIQSVERNAGGAVARVSFFNMGEHHVVTLRMDYRGDRWLVGDIREGEQSLLAGGQAR
ncbi:MAG TPA: DUF3828 domain-containing protein [Allosphingosinicella sp.]|nr:DUF3828 domain-containing protein [Allosphingosinicella sp.]